MARTQAAEYEERREAIVEHAARLFAKTGFLGASVAELAAACATSKSLIYHYYPSKEDILFAVMISHLDQLSEDVNGVVSARANPAEQLKVLVHKFMQHYVGAADRQKVLLNELDNLPQDRRSEIVTKQKAIVDSVQTILVALNPDLVNERARARVQTMLLFGMINWTHTWFNPQGEVSADEVADMALDLIGAADAASKKTPSRGASAAAYKPAPALKRRSRP